jgi:hypothetical protein
MHRTISRLAILAAALSVSACACQPSIGDTAAQVVEQCGASAEIFTPPQSPQAQLPAVQMTIGSAMGLVRRIATDMEDRINGAAEAVGCNSKA